MWMDIYSTKVYTPASRMKYSIRETAAAAPDLFCGKCQWQNVTFHHCKFAAVLRLKSSCVQLPTPGKFLKKSVSGLLSFEGEKLWLVLLQLVRWCRVWQDDNSVFMRGGDRGPFQHSGGLWTLTSKICYASISLSARQIPNCWRKNLLLREVDRIIRGYSRWVSELQPLIDKFLIKGSSECVLCQMFWSISVISWGESSILLGCWDALLWSGDSLNPQWVIKKRKGHLRKFLCDLLSVKEPNQTWVISQAKVRKAIRNIGNHRGTRSAVNLKTSGQE